MVKKSVEIVKKRTITFDCLVHWFRHSSTDANLFVDWPSSSVCQSRSFAVLEPISWSCVGPH